MNHQTTAPKSVRHSAIESGDAFVAHVHDKLASDYEDAYVTHLEHSEGGVDLEDRLAAALELSDLASRMVATGQRERMKEIHASYRWNNREVDEEDYVDPPSLIASIRSIATLGPTA